MEQTDHRFLVWLWLHFATSFRTTAGIRGVLILTLYYMFGYQNDRAILILTKKNPGAHTSKVRSKTTKYL